jgi:hypothetical protein
MAALSSILLAGGAQAVGAIAGRDKGESLGDWSKRVINDFMAKKQMAQQFEVDYVDYQKDVGRYEEEYADYRGDYQRLLDAELRREEQMAEAGAPFRELAGEAAGLLREDIMREPGTSPLYQKAYETGIEDIAATRSKLGLLKGGATERMIGEFAGTLRGREMEDIRRSREALLEYGTTGLYGPTGGPGARTPLTRAGERPDPSAIFAPPPTRSRGTGGGELARTLGNLPMQALYAKEMFGKEPVDTDTPDYYGRRW